VLDIVDVGRKIGSGFSRGYKKGRISLVFALSGGEARLFTVEHSIIIRK
jgi:hypothetical protein